MEKNIQRYFMRMGFAASEEGNILNYLLVDMMFFSIPTGRFSKGILRFLETPIFVSMGFVGIR